MSDADNLDRTHDRPPAPSGSNSEAEDQSPSRSYYYDDSTGYEIYKEDEDEGARRESPAQNPESS